MYLRIFVLLALSLSGLQLPATIRYIKPAGDGAMDGSSWANAARGVDLQFAIDLSVPGDEVWVAVGTYATTPTLSRTVAFSMRNGVRIYGSFAGSEVTLAERSFAQGPTSILTGEIGVAGIADNSYHVISNGPGLDTTAVLDGFVIRDANDDRSPTLTAGLGGGIYNAGGAGNVCSPQIRNCVITNNFAAFGAGIFNSGYNSGVSSPYIYNCIIVLNSAYMGGGGIDNFGLAGTASPTIVNTLVMNNVAQSRAGGMYCWGGNNGNASPTVINSVFYNNQALDNVPGSTSGGGGIVADVENSPPGSFSGNANPVIRNSIFWGNQTAGTGPQFYLIGPATFNATYSDIELVGQTAPHTITGPGTGNISSDPLFLSAGNGPGLDGFWMTIDDGLTLQALSPCANVGDNAGVSAQDLKHQPRIAFSTVDMGAYESTTPPLAIDWLQFWGEATPEANLLHWRCDASVEIPELTIERSDDGIVFATIGTEAFGYQDGASIAFQFRDQELTERIHYYRLRSVDADGVVDYSDAIMLENAAVRQWVAYPNPTTGRFGLLGTQDEALRAELIDAQGKITPLEQASALEFDISTLPKGVYFLRIMSPETTEVMRLLKQ